MRAELLIKDETQEDETWADCQHTYRGSFLARTLASNFKPFLTTYSANLSMTGWMSGGGGMMAVDAGAELWDSAFELLSGELKD